MRNGTGNISQHCMLRILRSRELRFYYETIFVLDVKQSVFSIIYWDSIVQVRTSNVPSRWLRFNFFVFLYGISHAAMFQKSFVDSLHTKLVFVTASTGPFTKQSQFIPKLLAGMCIRLTGFWQFISKTVTMVINRKKEKEVLNSNQISTIYRAYFDQFHITKALNV